MTPKQVEELAKKRQTLIEVATELNEQMGLEPEIDTGDDASIEYLLVKIQKAAGLIEPDDIFTDQTQQILDYFI